MAETQILGVDFSGGGDDDHVGNTWVANGTLDGDRLSMGIPQAVSRATLASHLETTGSGSVAAIDFPFGVPREFLKFHGCEASTMPAVWERFSCTTPEEFRKDVRKLASERNDKGEKHVEVKRVGDERHYSEAMSPLNLRMYRMTLRGMQMLHRLHLENPTRWSVPPLKTSSDSTVCLLEVMPGAFLNSIGFPRTVTKYYKNAKNYRDNRKYVVECLADKVKPLDIQLNLSGRVRGECLQDDNCLDSVIAAVAAAAWQRCPDRFRHPQDSEEAAARLEGWIYAPRPSI